MAWFVSSQSYSPAFTSQTNTAPFVVEANLPSTRMSNDEEQLQSDGTGTFSQHSDSPRLPMAEIGMINKKAQIHGTITGITAGLLFAFVTRNFLKQSANITMVTGLATGTTAGYFSTRSNLHRSMRHLQDHHQIVERSKSDLADDREMQRLDLRAGDQRNYQGGVAGMYNYQDRSHSTRGDH